MYLNITIYKITCKRSLNLKRSSLEFSPRKFCPKFSEVAFPRDRLYLSLLSDLLKVTKPNITEYYELLAISVFYIILNAPPPSNY